MNTESHSGGFDSMDFSLHFLVMACLRKYVSIKHSRQHVIRIYSTLNPDVFDINF